MRKPTIVNVRYGEKEYYVYPDLQEVVEREQTETRSATEESSTSSELLGGVVGIVLIALLWIAIQYFQHSAPNGKTPTPISFDSQCDDSVGNLLDRKHIKWIRTSHSSPSAPSEVEQTNDIDGVPETLASEEIEEILETAVSSLGEPGKLLKKNVAPQVRLDDGTLQSPERVHKVARPTII